MKEFLWSMSFFALWGLAFGPILGSMGAVKLYFIVRFFESHWFIWITQMSHLPMEVDHDHDLSWFRLQLNSTCNVEPSLFNNWFSGHLNYQIEHQ
jgi:fatty acid desaturase